MARDLFERGLQALLQLAVIMVTLFVLNWPLALLVLLMLPLVALQPQRKLGPTLEGIDRIRKMAERVNGLVQDQVSTQPLVRAFGRGEETSRRFEHDVAGAYRWAQRVCAGSPTCGARCTFRNTCCRPSSCRWTTCRPASRCWSSAPARPELCRAAEPGHLLGLHPVPADPDARRRQPGGLCAGPGPRELEPGPHRSREARPVARARGSRLRSAWMQPMRNIRFEQLHFSYTQDAPTSAT